MLFTDDTKLPTVPHLAASAVPKTATTPCWTQFVQVQLKRLTCHLFEKPLCVQVYSAFMINPVNPANQTC